MKKVTLFAIVTIFVLCFSSCTDKKGEAMNIIKSDIPIMDLVTNEYKYSSVTSFLNKDPNVNELNSKFKNNFYKYFLDMYYTVIKTDEGMLIVYFDTNMRLEGWSKISFSENSTYESLKSLSKNISLYDVLKLDPNGNYPFIYSGWSGYPRMSYHFFKNGTVYLIQYDSLDKVISIDKYIL